MGESEETPWAVAKRLKAEGHPKSVIVERLKAMGLDDSDIHVLLFDDLPPPVEQDAGSALLAVGAMVVAGPLVGSLVAAALSNAQTADAPLAPLQALGADDASARCARHPQLASVANCPRCGSFACRDCAPTNDQGFCEPCRRSPAIRDLRIRKATRWVAFWMFCVPIAQGLQLAEEFAGPNWSYALSFLLIVGGPFAVLGFVQLAVRNLWPAFVATVLVAPLLLAAQLLGWWIVFAVLLIIASLFARTELIAARKACSPVTDSRWPGA